MALCCTIVARLHQRPRHCHQRGRQFRGLGSVRSLGRRHRLGQRVDRSVVRPPRGLHLGQRPPELGGHAFGVGDGRGGGLQRRERSMQRRRRRGMFPELPVERRGGHLYPQPHLGRGVARWVPRDGGPRLVEVPSSLVEQLVGRSESRGRARAGRCRGPARCRIRHRRRSRGLCLCFLGCPPLGGGGVREGGYRNLSRSNGDKCRRFEERKPGGRHDSRLLALPQHRLGVLGVF
mmetsp:Transcript_25575/g.77127  ORF Transcript_25575/g.77127 Transcript_25575/m.77127 type:complete len:234 (+) Transcript_25575:602-1303(+)